MNNLLENPFAPFIVGAILFLLCIAITRAIFSIPKFLKYQKAQTILLIKMAEQNGVSESTISRIIAIVEPKESTPEDKEKNSLTYLNERF